MWNNILQFKSAELKIRLIKLAKQVQLVVRMNGNWKSVRYEPI